MRNSAPEDSSIRRLQSAEPDMESLVSRARRGDQWGCEMLYRACLDDVTRVATFVLGRSADVEDVVHDAFVRAFDRIDQLQDPTAFGAWVARIAVNFARTRLRRRRVLRAAWLDRSECDIDFERIASDDASADQIAELGLVARALESLAPDARAAWVLRRVEGWALADIADTLSVSLATVKRRVGEGDTVVERHVRRTRISTAGAGR